MLEKMKVFLWLAIKNKLHIREILTKKGWNVSASYMLCRTNVELEGTRSRISGLDLKIFSRSSSGRLK